MEFKNQVEQQSHALTTGELIRRYGLAMSYAGELKVSVDAVKQRASRQHDFPPALRHTKTRMFATPLFAAWLLGISFTESKPESPVPPRRGLGRPRKIHVGGAK